MARHSSGREQAGDPALPQTSPSGVGPDASPWVSAAISRLDTTLASFQVQLARIESDLKDLKSDFRVEMKEVRDEVKGHGNWAHTTKILMGALWALVIAIVAPIVVIWAKNTLLK